MQDALYWAAKSVIFLIQALPLEWVARLGRAGGALAYLLDRRHGRVALQNLTTAFPEKNPAEIRALAVEHFKRLGENYACAVKTSGMPTEKLLPHFSIVGVDRIAAELRRGGNHVAAIGHFGNFEIYAFLARMVPGIRGATTYRGFKQPGLNRLLQELRNRSGCLYFERRSEFKRLLQIMREGGVLLGLLSDQHAGTGGVWINFFGRECSTSTAPAVLALRYNAPLTTGICFRVGLARWRVEFGEDIPLYDNGKARSLEAIMQDVNTIFETAIRRDPANWFWVHRRWRPRPAEKVAAAPV